MGHMLRPKAPLASLFGLAPGGVCRAADVATRAVRSYRTISPLPAPLARRLGGIFLLHFPWARAPQALPGTLPCGARTFLHVLAHTATAWPTLGAHHTLLFELQRPLVGLVVAHRGDVRRETCGLLQRQLRRAAARAPDRARRRDRPRRLRRPRARAAPATTSTISPRAKSASAAARRASCDERAAVQRLVQLGDLARDRRAAPLGPRLRAQSSSMSRTRCGDS